ncbi:MAG TPA: hypothetical protein VL147_01805 [Devosia sp.]|nr:hypothetical protein [Devosia sp.]
MVFKGASRRRINDHDDRMALAWHTARLTAYPPAKSEQFIKLEKLMFRDPDQVRGQQQSSEQQLAIVRGWVGRKG